MATLGEALQDLLRAGGVPGPVRRIEGGPVSLLVEHYVLGDDGQKVVTEDGFLMAVKVLNLRDEEPNPQVRRYDSLDDLTRAAQERAPESARADVAAAAREYGDDLRGLAARENGA